MVLPVAILADIVASIVKGPLSKVIEAHVADGQLQRKLASEIQSRLIDELAGSAALGQGVVIAEASSEHWLVRSWRPMLMVMMMAFLALAGFVVPLAELLAGPIRFEPRWSALPPELWTLLSVGMGGYIGGRSLEKIADRIWGAADARNSGKR